MLSLASVRLMIGKLERMILIAVAQRTNSDFYSHCVAFLGKMKPVMLSLAVC